jgi:polyhydroxyalkanoate synthesis regulator phasin
MSNAQQIEHQPGRQDAAAQTTGTSEPSIELRPDLKAQILQMNPADAGPLSEMLKLYPNLSGGILLFAASHLGNAFVQRAIALANNARPGGPSEKAAKGPLSNQEMHEFLDDAPAKAQPARAQPGKAPLSNQEMHEFLDDGPAKAPPAKGPLSNQEMHEFLEDPPANVQPAKGPLSNQEMHEFLEDGPAKAPPAKGPLSNQEMHEFLEDGPAKAQPVKSTAAPKPTQAVAEPTWVAGARAYNAAHSEWVDEFNELTGHVARLDGEGKVDPQAVARWQSDHGQAADGKIGPHTVAAARKLKAKAPEVAAAPQTDGRPPV